MSWAYYMAFAWTTPRFWVVGAVGIMPTLGMMALILDNDAALLGMALLALILAGIGAGWGVRPRLELRAEIPARVECGRPFTPHYVLANRGRRTAYDVTVESLPYPMLLELRLSPVDCPVLPPGQEVVLEGRARALRRGCYRLQPLRWDTDFPLGLWRRGRTDWTERRLSVYPAYAPLDTLDIPQSTHRKADLHEARRLTRAALEFHGCREYRAGDVLRHVHPRSSARLGVPVVKEYQEEGQGRIAMLVDTWLTTPLAWTSLSVDPVVEASLSLAAAVTEYLSRSDRVLELLIAGPGLYRFISAGRAGYFEDVLDILSAIEPCMRDPLPELIPRLIEEISEIQSVVLILGRWDRRRAALVKALRDREVGIKTVRIARPGKRAPDGFPPDGLWASCDAVRRGEVVTL